MKEILNPRPLTHGLSFSTLEVTYMQTLKRNYANKNNSSIAPNCLTSARSL